MCLLCPPSVAKPPWYRSIVLSSTLIGGLPPSRYSAFILRSKMRKSLYASENLSSPGGASVPPSFCLILLANRWCIFFAGGRCGCVAGRFPAPIDPRAFSMARCLNDKSLAISASDCFFVR